MSSYYNSNMIFKLLDTIFESSEVFNYKQYFDMFKGIPICTVQIEKYYNTLELFSFGTISDYVGNQDKYLKLKPEAISKLRSLTLTTLAEDYNELYLDFLTVQLCAGNKRETVDLLKDACNLGVITCSVDFKNKKAKFFSLRKRNTDVPQSVKRLVEIKDDVIEMFANRSTIFMIPVCKFTDVIKNIVVTNATSTGAANLKEETKLLKFIKSKDKKN